MNILKEARENQTAIIKITVGEADYAKPISPVSAPVWCLWVSSTKCTAKV